MAYIFGSIWDRFNRNALNNLSKSVEQQGKSIQDLVAEGQLTPTQYATLIESVNSLVKSGEITISDINKNRFKIDQTLLTEELLQQIAGTAEINAVPADGSITKKKMADKSISLDKTNFIIPSVNLFNPETRNLNTTLSWVDGSVETSGSNDTSDFIEIEEGRLYSISKISRLAWYDQSRGFISTDLYDDTLNHTVTAPNNAYFVKLIVMKVNINTAQINKGGSLRPYSSYKKPVLSDEITVSGDNVEGFSVEPNNTTFIRPSKNLFDKNTAYKGYYIESFSGNLQASSSNVTSDFMPVLPNEKYVFNTASSGTFIVVFFDADKTRISGIGNATSPVTTPANTAYVRFSFPLSLIDTMQFQKGETLTEYEEGGVFFLDENIKVSGAGGGQNKTHLSGQTHVYFGDSLTGMYADHVAYPAKLESNLGLEKAYNVGFSGTRMSAVGTATFTAFSLTALVDAITTDDWTLQNNYVDTRTNFQSHLTTLKEIDFTKVDVVSFFYGANDYGGNVALDNESDPYDKMTFAGACRYAIKNLSESYPHLKFVIISPSYRHDTEGVSNSAGFLMEDYFEAVKNVNEELSVPLINIMHNGQINRFNYGTYLQPDGLHFDQNKGLPRISDSIATLMLSKL